jgi:hypothetical protein
MYLTHYILIQKKPSFYIYQFVVRIYGLVLTLFLLMDVMFLML